MTAQKGFAPLLIIIVVAAVAIAGAGGAALVGIAPQCPTMASSDRSEKELAEMLEKSQPVAVTDGEATTIAQKYSGDKVQNLRVCSTTNLGNASGNIALGPFNPSFYASAGIDLSGSSPRATNLDIKVGSLPDIPIVSDQVKSIITGIINENLAKVALKKKYSVQFQSGSAIVTKLSD